MLRGRGADGCRRGPLSRQTHASPLLIVPKLGQYCAIEVVPSRLILEIHLDQPHVICMSVEITKAPRDDRCQCMCADSLLLEDLLNRRFQLI